MPLLLLQSLSHSVTQSVSRSVVKRGFHTHQWIILTSRPHRFLGYLSRPTRVLVGKFSASSMVLTSSYLRALVELCGARVTLVEEFIEFASSTNPAAFVARNLELRRLGDSANPPNRSLSNLGKLITNRFLLGSVCLSVCLSVYGLFLCLSCCCSVLEGLPPPPKRKRFSILCSSSSFSSYGYSIIRRSKFMNTRLVRSGDKWERTLCSGRFSDFQAVGKPGPEQDQLLEVSSRPNQIKEDGAILLGLSILCEAKVVHLFSLRAPRARDNKPTTLAHRL